MQTSKEHFKLPIIDLENITSQCFPLWQSFKHSKILITGGTGFLGKWLLGTLLWANQQLNLDISITVLSRDPNLFYSHFPHSTTNKALHFIKGDVRNCLLPDLQFSHCIHAATNASAKLNENDPLLMFDTIVDGTRQILDVARQAGCRKFLFISSGAVYGKQPYNTPYVSEDYIGSPNPLHVSSAYAEAKRAAEFLCAVYAQKWPMEIKIARGFAFVGPHLPLDIHFAIGNFIRDGLRGGPISVSGDGSPVRSYLYASDLISWLLTIFEKGEALFPYNVGSEDSISIADLAHKVAKTFYPVPVIKIEKEKILESNPTIYVPCTEKARNTLGLEVSVALPEAIARTVNWYRDYLNM